ncbi:MAG: hypothetical protein R2710_28345 [Acidimicrobiales bacterium]
MMLGAYKARVAPFNVNYRYVAEELTYLLTDAKATGIVVHSRFAPTLASILADLPDLRVIIQVPDDSNGALLPGAEWYEDVLAAASPASARRRVVTRRSLHPLHRWHHRCQRAPGARPTPPSPPSESATHRPTPNSNHRGHCRLGDGDKPGLRFLPPALHACAGH